MSFTELDAPSVSRFQLSRHGPIRPPEPISIVAMATTIYIAPMILPPPVPYSPPAFLC